MDPISISSLIISIAVALAFLINKIHLKHCKMGCIDSDCRSPANSPTDSVNIENIIETFKSAQSMNNLSQV
jgi:hypothetical protein